MPRRGSKVDRALAEALDGETSSARLRQLEKLRQAGAIRTRARGGLPALPFEVNVARACISLELLGRYGTYDAATLALWGTGWHIEKRILVEAFIRHRDTDIGPAAAQRLERRYVQGDRRIVPMFRHVADDVRIPGSRGKRVRQLVEAITSPDASVTPLEALSAALGLEGHDLDPGDLVEQTHAARQRLSVDEEIRALSEHALTEARAATQALVSLADALLVSANAWQLDDPCRIAVLAFMVAVERVHNPIVDAACRRVVDATPAHSAASVRAGA